jgi:hypothetical protein
VVTSHWITPLSVASSAVPLPDLWWPRFLTHIRPEDGTKIACCNIGTPLSYDTTKPWEPKFLILFPFDRVTTTMLVRPYSELAIQPL